jgi:hypothetical protein
MQSSGPQPQLAMSQGTKGTTGPLKSTSGDTTHTDNSGQVSFVCSNNSLVVVGSGVPCLWVPSMQGIQQAIQTSLKPLRHSPAVKLFTRVPIGIQASDTPESAPRAKQKVSASESLRGQGAVRRWSAGTGKCVAICDSLQNARLGKT